MSNKQKKLKKGLKLINDIQKIRSKNNKNWMDVLRLSLELDFNRTAKIIKEINKEDKIISKLANKIFLLRDQLVEDFFNISIKNQINSISRVSTEITQY